MRFVSEPLYVDRYHARSDSGLVDRIRDRIGWSITTVVYVVHQSTSLTRYSVRWALLQQVR